VTDPYALLDAGDGRRLERFGSRIVDRPSPSAEGRRGDPSAWGSADLVFERGTRGERARWAHGADAAPWIVPWDGLQLELRPASGGQVGVFPEHAQLWRWIRDAVGRSDADAPEVLSLFAYTGGASLAAAAAGARVAHVDAAKPAVAWARRNAACSGLSEAPIRWLIDDARAFVGREVRRGRRYDGFIVDPPSYGHGPTGDAWRLELDLVPLLRDLATLAGGEPSFILLTAHTPGVTPDQLTERLGDAFGVDAEAASLELRAATGRRLELGSMARWVRP
jgi:23S rRNA (cytosine1962-C5)-methyltransferase